MTQGSYCLYTSVYAIFMTLTLTFGTQCLKIELFPAAQNRYHLKHCMRSYLLANRLKPFLEKQSVPQYCAIAVKNNILDAEP